MGGATRSAARYGDLVVDTAEQGASDINRELTAALVEAGRRRGFQVTTEYPVPGGRLDVVWSCDVDMEVVGVARQTSRTCQRRHRPMLASATLLRRSNFRV